jgi:hypothetical protein
MTWQGTVNRHVHRQPMVGKVVVLWLPTIQTPLILKEIVHGTNS